MARRALTDGKSAVALAHLRRASGIADAGVSSLGNLTVSIVAARSLSLTEFGFISVTMLAGLVTIGAGRAVWGDPLTLVHAADEPGQRIRAARIAVSSYLTLAMALAPGLFVVAAVILILTGATAAEATALAGGLACGYPVLALQDILRQAAYCVGDPVVAFANSAAWTIAVLAALPIAWSLQVINAPFLVAVWTGCGLAGCGVGSWMLGIRPWFGSALSWPKRHRRLARMLLSDYALTQVTAETSVMVIAVVAGAAEAGLIRKAQLPLSPLVIMTTGIISVAQPALVRRVAGGAATLRVKRLVYGVGGVAAGAALAAGALVWTLPVSVMRVLVGSDWDAARPLVPILTVYLALGALGGCQGIALRAFGRVREQVKYRLVFSPVLVGGVALGAHHGARMAAVALCGGVLLVNLCWHHLLRTTPSLPGGNRCRSSSG